MSISNTFHIWLYSSWQSHKYFTLFYSCRMFKLEITAAVDHTQNKSIKLIMFQPWFTLFVTQHVSTVIRLMSSQCEHGLTYPNCPKKIKSLAVVNKISIRCLTRYLYIYNPFYMFSVLLTENIFRFEDNFSFTLRWSVFGALEARTGNKLKSGEQLRQISNKTIFNVF